MNGQDLVRCSRAAVSCGNARKQPGVPYGYVAASIELMLRGPSPALPTNIASSRSCVSPGGGDIVGNSSPASIEMPSAKFSRLWNCGQSRPGHEGAGGLVDGRLEHAVTLVARAAPRLEP